MPKQPLEGPRGGPQPQDKLRTIKIIGRKLILAGVLGRFAAGAGEATPPGGYSADTGHGGSRLGAMVQDGGPSVSAGGGKGPPNPNTADSPSQTAFDRGVNQRNSSIKADNIPPNSSVTRSGRALYIGGRDGGGPDSAGIAKERNKIKNEETFGNPDVLSKRPKNFLDSSDISDALGTAIETAANVGSSAIKWYFGSGSILTACSVIPNAIGSAPTVAPTEVKPQNPGAYPTLTPDPTLSDSTLSNNLVAYLKSGNIEVAPTPTVDEQFIAGYMAITGAALLARFPNADISSFNVRMVVNRTLLDSWEKNGSPPTMIINHGQERYTLTSIKMGNIFDWRIEKLSSDSQGIDFIEGGAVIIRQGIGENSFTGKKQADQIWDKDTGMWYDASNLPTDLQGTDILSARNAFAPQLATASRSIYSQNNDVSLSEMVSIKKDGKVTWVITGDDGQARFVDAKGKVIQPPRTPKDMRGRFDDYGNWVWQRQIGPDFGSPWQTINIFDPTTGQMMNGDQLPAVTPTEAPTLAHPPTAAVAEAPKATATPVDFWNDKATQKAWQAELVSADMAVKEKAINEWLQNVSLTGFTPQEEARLRQVLGYLKYLPKQAEHVLLWVHPPKAPPNLWDDPLSYIKYIKYIKKGDVSQTQTDAAGLTLNLNEYSSLSEEEQPLYWVATVMKEGLNIMWWHSRYASQAVKYPEYYDLAAEEAKLFTFQALVDARNSDGTFLLSDKVRTDLRRLISDYIAYLNKEATGKGWQ